MRKLLAAVSVSLLVAALAACGGDDDSASSTSTSARSGTEPASDFTPRTDGQLTVGTELPAPPFWIGDDYDQVSGGYEVDLAKALGEELGGLEFKPVNYPFVGVNAGAACECDIVFAQITITPERAEKWDFTDAYLDSDQGLMVAAGTQVADVAAAKKLHYAVQAETTGLDFLNDQLKPDQDPLVYDTTVDMFNALGAGDANAILFDVPILLGAIEAGQAPEGAEIIAQFETGEQYGGILPKDSPNTAAVNAALKTLIDNGTLERLQQQYFGQAVAPDIPLWKVES